MDDFPSDLPRWTGHDHSVRKKSVRKKCSNSWHLGQEGSGFKICSIISYYGQWCGSVGRVVASDVRGLRFVSSHRQFFKWAIPGLFFFIFAFSIQWIVNAQYKFLPMSGFKLRTSEIGSDRSTNWTTTTAPGKILCWMLNVEKTKLKKKGPTIFSVTFNMPT